MQPHTVTTSGISYVNHGVDVVGNGEVNGSFHQPEEGLFEV
jgi:hypothetical protein